MIPRLLITLLLLTASLVNAQTTGQLSYDIYNGTVFEQKNLSPSEGLYLKWQNGLLVNASASGGTWGSITGTLSNQTDLQDALDAKLANSDLFNLSEDGSGNGRLRLWDETDGNWRDMTAIDGGVSFSGDIYVTGTVGAGNLSGMNTGDQTTITGNSGTTTAALGLKTATSTVGLSTATAPSSGQVLTATSSTAATWQTPAATGVTSVTGTGTVNGLTLTGTVTSTGNLTLGGTLSNVSLTSAVTGTLPVANGGVHPLVTTGDTGSGYGRIGLWDDDAGAFIYFQAGAAKFLFPDIQATSFTGNGNQLTSLNAGNISSGTLPVANGGTGATTLTANNVLLGNGTSALQAVAPGTNGNVLTSDGTTWTSAAPAAGAIQGYKRATYTSTASGTTTCAVIASTTLRAMTEGDQYMTITYTPTNAASRLVVRVRFMAGCSSVAWGGLLLARSGDANARVQCTGDNGAVINNTSSVSSHTLILDEVAGGTSAITYNVRFGGNAAGTFYMNRASGGVYPAGTESSIEVTEYAP